MLCFAAFFATVCGLNNDGRGKLAEMECKQAARVHVLKPRKPGVPHETPSLFFIKY